MGRLFDMDSGIMRFLTRVADLMILNLLFVATCIPIVTIGASCTALYYVTLKMVRNEDAYIARSYFRSFRQNFKQATIMWLIVLVFIIVILLDFRILGLSESSGLSVVRVGVFAAGIFGVMILTYLFPVLSKFYNTVKRTFINSFLMSIRHLPQTVIMIAISVAAVALTILNNFTFMYGILMWVLLGFSTIALAKSWFLVRIFDHYIPKETEDADGTDTAEEEPALDGEEVPALEGDAQAVDGTSALEEDAQAADDASVLEDKVQVSDNTAPKEDAS